MKKIFALALALSLSLSLAACGNNSGSGSGTTPPPADNSSSADKSGGTTTTPAPANNVTLKLGFSTNEEDPRALGAKQFKEEVESKTNGAVTIEIYPSGQLGGDADLINSISLDSGTVDIIITDASNFATYEPKMGISALPFQFADFEEAWAFMDSAIEAEAEAGLIPQNMRVLAHYCNGFRCVTNSKGPVESPADMKGMLIRTPENPVIMATMTAMGANPQPLAFNVLYQALKQGTYDAQENPIELIYSQKFYEQQSHINLTNHLQQTQQWLVNLDFYNNLSDENKAVLDAGIQAACDAATNYALDNEAAWSQEIKEHGCTFVELTDEQRAAFQEAVAPEWESIKTAVAPEVWDAYTK